MLIDLISNEYGVTPAAENRAITEDLADAAVSDQILRLVKKRFAEPEIALHLLADELRLSSRHLGRLFQRHTGKTFRQCLRDVRIERAAHLLSEQQVDVKQVAAMVGYGSRGHFDEDFRTHMGRTPAQFKKSQRACQL